MIDLCISGIMDRDAVVFSLNGESKSADRFSGQIHFFLEENKTYRIAFEQRSEKLIPHCAEFLLNVLFLPLRGAFNVLTYNTVQNWEKDISAFRLSGYIEVNLSKNTEISFELKHGTFDKDTNCFYKPQISFSPDVLCEQACVPDGREIIERQRNYLLNAASAGLLLFALLFYLIFISVKNGMYIACIITSVLTVSFGILAAFLIIHSFKKRKRLISALISQNNKE